MKIKRDDFFIELYFIFNPKKFWIGFTWIKSILDRWENNYNYTKDKQTCTMTTVVIPYVEYRIFINFIPLISLNILYQKDLVRIAGQY